jgi:hypothetical protein
MSSSSESVEIVKTNENKTQEKRRKEKNKIKRENIFLRFISKFHLLLFSPNAPACARTF